MIFQKLHLYKDLLRSIFVTLLKKLSSEIVLFYFFRRQFLQFCFKHASEWIIVKIRCSKYQKLFKTLIRSRFQDMYWCAHKTVTLTSIQHTVLGWLHVYSGRMEGRSSKCVLCSSIWRISTVKMKKSAKVFVFEN